ncbi:Dockerin type I repeat protein [Rubripirellula tenax]|uniref:Dockerin type I repeat protein n=1 Tax=Rubripirellula tenax TaxID=2528015 RepID=A0A5C6F950_9BACT|nr:dockerin type I domain-containing protein [Rubripirellula tenax]TWU57090.1 Dockerin type I repeat protein [Rubripirellula tenax]
MRSLRSFLSKRRTHRSRTRTCLWLESLEKRQLLAATVIAPVDADLLAVGGSYLEYGANGSHWYDGSGLSDASIVETGDPVPATWPQHVSGNHSDRVSRIRNGAGVNTLTFDLGGTFDVTGMALWNSTEAGQSDRGFENTILSYSIDGGLTFTGNDTLTWTQRSADESANQGTSPTPPVAMFAAEVQMLPSTVADVTHIRMDVDNFSGEAIVMASEIRFVGETELPSLGTANLSVRTADSQLDLRQGQEAGATGIELTVTLDQPNISGASISFDLNDLGSGTATAGLDYVALPAGAKISVAAGQQTGTYIINVIDDFLIEATETVNFRISNPSNPDVGIDTSTVTTTIADNDNAGVTVSGAESLDISEAGSTDTYTIALDTIPTGAVEITATADAQTQVSIDGINFAATQVFSLTDMTSQTITVRAIDDFAVEGIHTGTITHAITGPIVDPNYPNVTLDDLYTQTGTDPSFQELIDSGALPTGSNTTVGITGSTIDVNNSVVEQGIHANTPTWPGINIHTLANSVIPRSNFDRWSRWYQEDGNTQVFRVFEGEENVRNTRALAARIESHSNGWQTGTWNDFSARYTIVKPESMAIFQSFQPSVEWSVHIGMSANGGIHFTHRRANGGGQLTIPLAEDMVGKSFDIRIRENGLDYEVYFNGELKGRGQYEKPDNIFQFRWGTYRGANPMTRDSLIFVTGASIQANTSAPLGLVPYRPATTSLSIASATTEITDNDPSQSAYTPRTVTTGTRIEAEEFDLGGQNVAYYDTTAGNSGGVDPFRADEDVDVYGSGNRVIGNARNGEWLEYTADVVAGTYDIGIRVASPNDNTMSVRLLVGDDNSTETFTELGTVVVPNTGGFGNWVVPKINNVDLSAWAGEDRVFRIEIVGGTYNFDWFEFTANEPVLTSVVGRSVAYRGAGATYGEGMADPNKSALHGPSATTSMANYTNYSQGLNRVIVDIDNLPATTLAASDFEFRVGNTEDFGNSLAWTSMPASAIDVAPLAGTTKRVTIDWPHQAIMNKWLEVTIKANANTGLTQDDVFYFGNQVGDINGSTSASKHVTVNAFDTLGVRFNQSPTSNSVGIDNIYDIDRNGSVNAFDTLGVRFNQMPSGGLMMITLPPAAAPPTAASIASEAIQNPDNALDVNGDGQVTALDALMGINFLGQTIASSELTGFARRPSSANFYDVNGDGRVTALDSLRIINKLGRSSDQLAEQMFIPQLESISDDDDDLDWVSDRQRQQVGFIDLALIAWN